MQRRPPRLRRPSGCASAAIVAAVAVTASCVASRGLARNAFVKLPPRCAQFKRRAATSLLFGGSVASFVASVSEAKHASAALPPPVNNPELLPNTPGDSTPIVDVARILSTSQLREMDKKIKEVESKSNVKIRVLAQTYPNSPGKAIQKYWNVDTCKAEGVSADDPTCKGDPNVLVYVHDTGGLGSANVNFSVGKDVEARKPRTFWRQIQNKFGNRFYIRDHGDAETMLDVVSALHDAFV